MMSRFKDKTFNFTVHNSTREAAETTALFASGLLEHIAPVTGKIVCCSARMTGIYIHAQQLQA